jgi:hypothetical protein
LTVGTGLRGSTIGLAMLLGCVTAYTTTRVTKEG